MISNKWISCQRWYQSFPISYIYVFRLYFTLVIQHFSIIMTIQNHMNCQTNHNIIRERDDKEEEEKKNSKLNIIAKTLFVCFHWHVYVFWRSSKGVYCVYTFGRLTNPIFILPFNQMLCNMPILFAPLFQKARTFLFFFFYFVSIQFDLFSITSIHHSKTKEHKKKQRTSINIMNHEEKKKRLKNVWASGYFGNIRMPIDRRCEWNSVDSSSTSLALMTSRICREMCLAINGSWDCQITFIKRRTTHF